VYDDYIAQIRDEAARRLNIHASSGHEVSELPKIQSTRRTDATMRRAQPPGKDRRKRGVACRSTVSLAA